MKRATIKVNALKIPYYLTEKEWEILFGKEKTLEQKLKDSERLKKKWEKR